MNFIGFGAAARKDTGNAFKTNGGEQRSSTTYGKNCVQRLGGIHEKSTAIERTGKRQVLHAKSGADAGGDGKRQRVVIVTGSNNRNGARSGPTGDAVWGNRS